jgi:thiol-disulfide isomerase/thioredoxin
MIRLLLIVAIVLVIAAAHLGSMVGLRARDWMSDLERPPAASAPMGPGAPAEAEAFDPALGRKLLAAGFRPADMLAPAPRLEVIDTKTGQQVRLDSLSGKVVLVWFWQTDSPVCDRGLAALDTLVRSLAGKKVEVLCVCIDQADALLVETAAPPQTKCSLCYDPSAGTPMRYVIYRVPSAVLIDGAGRLLGRADWDLDWSNPAIRAMLLDI